MAYWEVSCVDVIELVRRWHAGERQRRIAQDLGMAQADRAEVPAQGRRAGPESL